MNLTRIYFTSFIHSKSKTFIFSFLFYQIVVLNVRENDENATITTTFISTYSLKKEYYKLIINHVTKIKENWAENKDPENPMIRNLVVKDFTFTKRDTAYGMKENVDLFSRSNNNNNKK